MEILGVGVPEMMFIVLIALILLGPKDMIAAGRTFGKFLRQFLTSPTWQAMRRTGEELQQLPTKLAREAGLDDLQKDMQDIGNQIKPALDIKNSFNEANVFDTSKKLYIPEEPSKSIPVSAPEPPLPSNPPNQPIEPLSITPPEPLPPSNTPDQPTEPPTTIPPQNND